MTWKSLNHYLTYPSILRNRNFWVLFGTCSTWFLLDISFYSQNLFLPNVLVSAACFRLVAHLLMYLCLCTSRFQSDDLTSEPCLDHG